MNLMVIFLLILSDFVDVCIIGTQSTGLLFFDEEAWEDADVSF
jgi:hypothetical protein